MTVTLFCHWGFWVGNAWLINYAQVRGQRIWSWKKKRKQISCKYARTCLACVCSAGWP